MPGGQSSSVLGASLEVLLKSTGTSTSILGFGGLDLVVAEDFETGEVFGGAGDGWEGGGMGTGLGMGLGIGS